MGLPATTLAACGTLGFLTVISGRISKNGAAGDAGGRLGDNHRSVVFSLATLPADIMCAD